MKSFLSVAVVTLLLSPLNLYAEEISAVEELLLAEELAQLENVDATDGAAVEEPAAEILPWLVKEEVKEKVKQEVKIVDVVFEEGDISINEKNSLKLDYVFNLLNESPDLKIILKSYSGKVANHLNGDRRESLRRALAVRKYFISNGVNKTRISVKAMGNSEGGDAEDKVEIFEI